MKLCYYTKWAVYFLTKQSYAGSSTLNRETVWKVNPPIEKIKLIIDGFCQYFCQLWKRISDVHLVVLFSPEILKEAKTFLKLYLNNWIRFSYSISAMVRTKFKVLFTEDIILPLFSLILVSLKTGFCIFSSMYQSPSLNTQSCIRRPLCSTFRFENLSISPKKKEFFMFSGSKK